MTASKTAQQQKEPTGETSNTKSSYEKLGEKRKVKQEFSSLSKEWRKRCDLVEITSKGSVPVYFSAVMAKKYATIFLFTFYFGEDQPVWHDRILEILGWDHKRLKQQYTMILYRLIRGLRRDFNIEIKPNTIKKNSEKYAGFGLRYYTIEDFGFFNKKKLLKTLKDNSEIFTYIIENGIGAKSYIYLQDHEARNRYKYDKEGKDSEYNADADTEED